MTNLTFNQKLAIAAAVLGALATASTNITDILTPFMDPKTAAALTKSITSLCTLVGGILAAILAFFTGQASIVKEVQAMPGVEKIVVNENANKTLASAAIDPANPKILPAPDAEQAVLQTAAGTQP